LRFRFELLALSFVELAIVSSLFLVVNAFDVLSNHLPVLRLRRLYDQGKTLREGPVLEACIRYLSRLGRLVLAGIKAMGGWEGGGSSCKLSLKLSRHGFTRDFSKCRLHDEYI
jgi:hypothetical protein